MSIFAIYYPFFAFYGFYGFFRKKQSKIQFKKIILTDNAAQTSHLPYSRRCFITYVYFIRELCFFAFRQNFSFFIHFIPYLFTFPITYSFFNTTFALIVK